MTIEKTLKIEILDLEEDYPDQNKEYRDDRILEGLAAFVHSFSYESTESRAEAELLRYRLLVRLLSGLASGFSGPVVKERLGAHHDSKETKTA